MQKLKCLFTDEKRGEEEGSVTPYKETKKEEKTKGKRLKFKFFIYFSF